MFESATLKLTAWYLAILMSVSILFSFSIYFLNFNEVNTRLENLQQGYFGGPLPGLFPGMPTFDERDQLRLAQAKAASEQMILTLLYINIVILVGGGFGSYLLARRTLRPLERSHEAQSRFTSDASHELRTPLAAMKAELEVTLRDPKLDEAEARELLESNLEEVNKLIALSEMLLKLARLDYDKLERSKIDIVELVHENLRHFPDHQKRFDITTKKHGYVIANEPGISEVITILVDNAIKYSPEDTRISIRVFERRMMLGFEISNEGTPIPSETQSKLFERFYRRDDSRTQSNKNGYGLGLAIARKIIDIHHGDITVFSDDDATKFTFYLPNLRYTQAKTQSASVE